MKSSALLPLLLVLIFAAAENSAIANPLKATAAELDARIVAAEARLKAFQAKEGKAIPEAILANAQGIVIMRKIKAGLGIGVEAGGGLALIRKDGAWSAPAFVAAAEASWGLQFGAQDSDIIMVFMTRESLKFFEKGGNANLGIEALATVGPVDVGSDLDLEKLKAPVLVYTDAAGGFAGLTLKGGGIVGAKKKNHTYYGKGMQEILFFPTQMSDNARRLIAAIELFSGIDY